MHTTKHNEVTPSTKSLTAWTQSHVLMTCQGHVLLWAFSAHFNTSPGVLYVIAVRQSSTAPLWQRVIRSYHCDGKNLNHSHMHANVSSLTHAQPNNSCNLYSRSVTDVSGHLVMFRRGESSPMSNFSPSSAPAAFMFDSRPPETGLYLGTSLDPLPLICHALGKPASKCRAVIDSGS